MGSLKETWLLVLGGIVGAVISKAADLANSNWGIVLFALFCVVVAVITWGAITYGNKFIKN
jgi:hypothetical protein